MKQIISDPCMYRRYALKLQLLRAIKCPAESWILKEITFHLEVKSVYLHGKIKSLGYKGKNELNQTEVGKNSYEYFIQANLILP